MSQTENKAWNEQENKGIPFPSPAKSGTDPAITNPPSDEIYTGQDYRSVSTKEAEKKDSIGKDISILVMITLVSGLLLGIAYGITKDPIAKAQEDARVAAQRMVMRSAKSFPPQSPRRWRMPESPRRRSRGLIPPTRRIILRPVMSLQWSIRTGTAVTLS